MKFYTRKETCQMLNISIPTLNRYMKSGKINYSKSGLNRSCKVLFSQSDILEYINKNKK